EVQRGALTREDRPQRSRELAELHPRVHGIAVVRGPLHRDVRVELSVGLARECGAGEHTIFAGNERGDRGLVLAHTRDRRDVAECAEILGERFRHETADEGMRRIEVGHCDRLPARSDASGARTSTCRFTNAGARPRNTNRPRKASDGSGYSRRAWAPRDSRRAIAAATIARDTRSRLQTS